MTDFDLFIVSLIINIGLIIQNRIQHHHIVKSLEMLTRCSMAIAQAADGKGEFYRADKKILMREVKRETN